jgi:hypothetical protein
MMLTQTVLALALLGSASAAWAVPLLALQGFLAAGREI